MQMLALQQHIGETPDIDVARVEQLRADINQNRYQIDAGRIADRLVQLERRPAGEHQEDRHGP